MTISADSPADLSGRDLDLLIRDVLVDQSYPERCEVAVHLISIADMEVRNSQAFGKTGPTDVISLPIEDLRAGEVPAVAETGPPLQLGDVFIAPDVVRDRALVNGFDPADEMALMAVHGILHLMGHDHIDDSEAEVMETIETRILANHGYSRR